MKSGLQFKRFSVFSTYKVIGLLEDKTLYKENVFHLNACYEFTTPYFTKANATQNNP